MIFQESELKWTTVWLINQPTNQPNRPRTILISWWLKLSVSNFKKRAVMAKQNLNYSQLLKIFPMESSSNLSTNFQSNFSVCINIFEVLESMPCWNNVWFKCFLWQFYKYKCPILIIFHFFLELLNCFLKSSWRGSL